MTTRNVRTAKLLTLAQKCTDHIVTFQDSMGLSSTDDPLKGEKVVNYEFSKSTKKKNGFHLVKKIGKGEDHNP